MSNRRITSDTLSRLQHWLEGLAKICKSLPDRYSRGSADELKTNHQGGLSAIPTYHVTTQTCVTHTCICV